MDPLTVGIPACVLKDTVSHPQTVVIEGFNMFSLTPSDFDPSQIKDLSGIAAVDQLRPCLAGAFLALRCYSSKKCTSETRAQLVNKKRQDMARQAIG